MKIDREQVLWAAVLGVFLGLTIMGSSAVFNWKAGLDDHQARAEKFMTDSAGLHQGLVQAWNTKFAPQPQE